MSNIGRLPQPVVEQILGEVLNNQALDAWSWKQQLSLLNVCRQWREIALPCIYALCFIKIREDFVYDSDSNEFDSDDSDSEDARVVLESSVNATVVRGFCHYVQHMHITLLWPSDPLVYIEEVLRMLGTHSADWTSVTTLSITFSSASSDERNTSYVRTCRVKKAVAKSAKRIAALMPCITTFNVHGYTSNGMADIFVRQLAESYSKQLQTLKCNIPLTLSGLHLSEALTHLHLQLDSGSSRLVSQFHAGSLRSLVLTNVPCNFSWRYFIGDSADEENSATFHQLESISVSYTTQPDKHKNTVFDGYKLNFPKLANISTQNCPANCSLLRAASHPLTLCSVSVTGPFSAFTALCGMRITCVGDLNVAITSIGESNMPGFYKAANQLFGGNKVSKILKLSLPQCGFVLDPQNIEWNNMTELVCQDSIEFSDLVSLIPRLPRVVKLDITSVTFGNLPVALLHQASNMDQSNSGRAPTESLNAQIKELRLFVSAYEYQVEQVVSAVQYLIVRIPSLRVLHLAEYIHQDILKFIERVKQQYPHVGNITVKHAFR
ncbi:hypothetical protein LPJ66_003401 [Kickxella alabastrina]|uniref:Uncharacterized protein n=1 Tax=Kickxella alabastrina TaxID=61397 RepID=A0ACC1IK63_9FUNG|nr:hypothetical protein LPJ66_003401 [Kickxella alabastrina]